MYLQNELVKIHKKKKDGILNRALQRKSYHNLYILLLIIIAMKNKFSERVKIPIFKPVLGKRLFIPVQKKTKKKHL